MYVDNVAEACIYFMNKKMRHALVNIGSEEEKTINEYAKLIVKKIGSNTRIKFDNNKEMSGTPRKILDCSLAKSYGWRKKITLDEGLELTLKDFLNKKTKKIHSYS